MTYPADGNVSLTLLSYIETLRREQFSHIKDNETYVDHAGATLYTRRQVEAHCNILLMDIYGNPHSMNTSSLRSQDSIDNIRKLILSHFNTNASEYDVIFTAGATASLKMIADCIHWNDDDNDVVFCHLRENHTSVLGIGVSAEAQGARTCSIDEDDVTIINGEQNSIDKGKKCGIFAYPAQCNYSGRKYSLEWIQAARNGRLRIAGHDNRRWKVILDAAGLVGTAPLDLHAWPADFVVLSFYKMFGFPTGLGALIVHKDAAPILSRKLYFGGGTIEAAYAGDDSTYVSLRKELSGRLEDGTVDFLGIRALETGFYELANLPGGMEAVASHVYALGRRLYDALKAMRYDNGQPMCVFYSKFDSDKKTQGGIVNFNMLDKFGGFVGQNKVEKLANSQGIHLRTGCFCNPGACNRALGLSLLDVKKHHAAGHVCWDEHDVIGGKATGSIRISFGYMSIVKDVDCVISFFRHFFLNDSNVNVNLDRKLAVLKMVPPCPRLERIIVYPVKSCAGIEVLSWKLGQFGGLEFDREWMIIDEASRVCLTMKKEPKMCLLRPRINGNFLELTYSGRSDFVSVPLVYRNEEAPINRVTLTTRVCSELAEGACCGEEAASWLSAVLGRRLRLVRQIAPRNGGLSYANESQLLLVSLDSVDYLNKLIHGEDITYKRFRPNLVVSCSGIAFDEDTWRRVLISDHTFEFLGPCQRCQMVCIDPVTGKRTAEPLRTLAQCRRDEKGKIMFGNHVKVTGAGVNCDELITESVVEIIERESPLK